jgi:hypothetical protein
MDGHKATSITLRRLRQLNARLRCLGTVLSARLLLNDERFLSLSLVA